MKYGMPYKGSKSKIAEQILNVLLSPDSRDTVKERLYCNHKYEIHEQLTFF